jgi:hypothetical protein
MGGGSSFEGAAEAPIRAGFFFGGGGGGFFFPTTLANPGDPGAEGVSSF